MPPIATPTRLTAWFQTMRFRAPVLLMVLMVLASPVAGAAPSPAEALPTQEEIHQLFEQKQYPQVLRKIAKALTVKGDAARQYDRHDLARLKAETHLRLKAYGPAEQAWIAAARETRDEKLADEDLATAALVHRSKAGQYQPVAKVNGRVPDAVSVVEPDARKAALEALFRDELAADAPRIQALRDTKSLDSLSAVTPTVATLRTLEMVATGGRDAQTRQLITPIAKNAQDLMGDMEQGMVRQLNTIIRRGYHRDVPGTDLIDRKELTEIRAVCAKIAPTARALGEAMGSDGTRLVAISTAAEQIAQKAAEITE